MAAIAITKPSEAKKIIRAIAPEAGGVRYPCLLCDTKEYSSLSNQEQMELFNLQEDILEIWETNQRLAERLKCMNDDENRIKKMNSEMQHFFDQIPLGNLTSTIGTQTDIEERDPNFWKEKERNLQYEVIQDQKKLIANLKSKQPIVPKGLWGHKSRTWPRFQNKNAVQSSSQKSSRGSAWKSSKPSSNSKPFSIPFCPKPLHLMVRKAYLKPPPKLPPVHSHTCQPTARLPKCGSLQCDDSINIEFREMFADALERAVNSNEADHPYYDHPEQESNQQITAVPDAYEGEAWEDHPFYDDLDHEEDQQDDDVRLADDAYEGVAWEDHPYYDDSFGSETGQGDDADLDTLDHEEDLGESHIHDEAAPDTSEEEVAWEDHPYYDTPDVEDSPAESDVSEDDASLQDHSSYTTTEEEDELAWEDSPYY